MIKFVELKSIRALPEDFLEGQYKPGYYQPGDEVISREFICRPHRRYPVGRYPLNVGLKLTVPRDYLYESYYWYAFTRCDNVLVDLY